VLLVLSISILASITLTWIALSAPAGKSDIMELIAAMVAGRGRILVKKSAGLLGPGTWIIPNHQVDLGEYQAPRACCLRQAASPQGCEISASASTSTPKRDDEAATVERRCGGAAEERDKSEEGVEGTRVERGHMWSKMRTDNPLSHQGAVFMTTLKSLKQQEKQKKNKVTLATWQIKSSTTTSCYSSN